MSKSYDNNSLNSFLVLGIPYFLHHFLILLSDTPNIFPTSTKDLVFINSKRFSFEGLFGLLYTILLCIAEHFRHLVLLLDISQPQSMQ